MNRTALSHTWCKIGIFALAVSGLYSVVLVLLRSPGMSDLIANKDFFRTALVVHVDLSVLVWMLAGSCVIWLQSISNSAIEDAVRMISKLAFFGIALILVAPFISVDATPILNNYIPMLDNFWFVLGLSIFACSVLIVSMLTLPNIGSMIFLFSALCLVLSSQKLQHEIIYPMDLHGFYEMLFWSPGHILQFLYMYTMQQSLVTTLAPKPVFPSIHKVTNITTLLMALLILPVHFFYNIDSAEFITACTEHMKYAGGIAAAGVLLSITCELFYSNSQWRMGAIFSLLLFSIGGVIGLLISGTNVTIPAHYHGSVVGVSLSIMCLVYFVLEIKHNLLFKAKIQIIVYSIGQMLHIGGLAWSGGYGVLRKDPSTALSVKAKIAMGVMGLGGMLAIIGGLMFVVICVRRISKSNY